MQPINQSEIRNPGPSHRPDWSPERQSGPDVRPPDVRPPSPLRQGQPNGHCSPQNSQVQTLPSSGESFALFPPVNVPDVVNDSFSQTQTSAFHNQILTEAGFQINEKLRTKKFYLKLSREQQYVKTHVTNCCFERILNRILNRTL